MVLRLGAYEVDLGELQRRVRTDVRYLLGVVAAALLFLCACGWLLYPRRVPTTTVYVAGPAGITVQIAAGTLAGSGPHAVPAGQYRAQVTAPGFYPMTLALTLTAGVTTTLTPTLYPRPFFQEIAVGLPAAGIDAVYLEPTGAVRFQVVVTATSATTAAAMEPVLLAQWWQMTPDGRREHLLALDAGPAALSPDGRLAVARPTGLFVSSSAETPVTPVLTATADVAGLAWWGAELALLRVTPTGATVELVAPDAPSPTTQLVAVLPALPDIRFVQPSPAGRYLLLLVRGRGSDTLLVLDRAGRVTYLGDLPRSPLPLAYATWEREGVLLWAAPQSEPGGATTWPIRRLDLEREAAELLAAPAAVHGVWVEGGAVCYLDGDAQVRDIAGRARYTLTEIDTRGDFALWKAGNRAVLYNAPPVTGPTPTANAGAGAAVGRPTPAGRYWLLTWPEGE